MNSRLKARRLVLALGVSAGVMLIPAETARGQMPYPTDPERMTPVKSASAESEAPEPADPAFLPTDHPLSSAPPETPSPVPSKGDAQKQAREQRSERAVSEKSFQKSFQARDRIRLPETARMLEQADDLLAGLAALESELKEADSAKEGLEKKYQELRLRLEPEGKPELEGARDSFAFYRQAAASLFLIRKDLASSHEGGSPESQKAAGERFRRYRDSGEPRRAAEELGLMRDQARKRRTDLVSLIQNAESLLSKRSAERRRAVKASLLAAEERIRIKGLPEIRRGFSEDLWPEYANRSRVRLPWEKQVWVESEIYQAEAEGLPLTLEFRNGQMDPSVLGASRVLRAAALEHPGRKVRLLRSPEVLRTPENSGGICRGFAYFLAVGSSDYELYETEISSPLREPRKTASFSLREMNSAMLLAADVNQDGKIGSEDADQAVRQALGDEISPKEKPELNSDRTFTLADALMIAAAADAGSEAVQYAQLKSYAERVLKAQKDFVRVVPGLWQTAETLRLPFGEAEFENLLQDAAPQEQEALRNLYDYCLLIQSSAESLRSLKPDLTKLRHPEFFEASGSLKESLSALIRASGLASLPEISLFEEIRLDAGLDELRKAADSMRARLGENPAEFYERSLVQMRLERDAVDESFEIAVSLLRDFRQKKLQDRAERTRLINYLHQAESYQDGLNGEAARHWAFFGNLRQGMNLDRLEALIQSGSLSREKSERLRRLLTYQNMISEAGRVISQSEGLSDFFDGYPGIFETDQGDMRPDFQAFLQRERLPALQRFEAAEAFSGQDSTETLRAAFERMRSRAGPDLKSYFNQIAGLQTQYFKILTEAYEEIEKKWKQMEAAEARRTAAAALTQKIVSGDLDFNGDGILGVEDTRSAENSLSAAAAAGSEFQLLEDQRLILDLNQDGRADSRDAAVLEERIRAAADDIRQAELLAERMKRQPDLDGDGVRDARDRAHAEEGYGAALRTARYLGREQLQALDLDRDGKLTLQDRDLLIGRMQELPGAAMRGLPFEASAALEENGRRDLAVKVQADGSAQVTFRGRVYPAVFEESSGMLIFELARDSGRQAASVPAVRIHLLRDKDGLSVDSAEIRRSIGTGSHVRRILFRRDGLPAADIEEFMSSAYVSVTSREYRDYVFFGGQSRAVSVETFSKISHDRLNFSRNVREQFSYQNIHGSAALTQVSRQISVREESGASERKTLEESKLFIHYSPEGMAESRVSMKRFTDSEGKVQGSAWASLDDPRSRTRTFLSAPGKLFSGSGETDSLREVENAAEIKRVEFYAHPNLQGNPEQSLEYARAKEDSLAPWKLKKRELSADSARSVSRIVGGGQEETENLPALIQGQTVVLGQRRYQAGYGPLYDHSASEQSPAYLGYGLYFRSLDTDGFVQEAERPVFVRDYPEERKVHFPDGRVYEAVLNTEGGVTLR